ncbi:type II toxin-antitoxin system PemK/MazF family toxin [Candidatus Saccharibacteria bacterium]|nr:type II toxin-antitoxin system PemK/MazF family toxin [Candidatus Saccharibacteria bacterium]
MDTVEEYKKDFDGWIELKKSMDSLGKLPTIDEGDIWWCGVGENVGVEISGKSKRFSRPVMVIKKLSRFGFMGVPLTSQPKTGSWYVNFVFQSKTEAAAICQARVMSVSRLYGKIGRVPESDLEKVKIGFQQLYK